MPNAQDGRSLTLLADGVAVLFAGRGSDGRVNDIHTLQVSSRGATHEEDDGVTA